MTPPRKTAAPRRPPRKRMAITLPAWLVAAIDWEANRIGIARGTLVEFWLTERLEAQVGRALHRRKSGKGD